MARVQYDDTIDTKTIDPEDDFAPIEEPAGSKAKPEEDSFDNENPALEDSVETDEVVETPAEGETEDTESEAVEQEAENPETDESDDDSIVDDLEATEEGSFAPELLEATGLTEDQARTEFGDEKNLARALNYLSRQYIEQGRKLSERTADQRQEAVEAQPEPFQLPPREDGMEWDPETVAIVEAVNKRMETELNRRDKEIQAQRERLDGIRQQHEQAERAKYVHEFEEWINALPDEYRPFLGSGEGRSMNPQSIQFQNRSFVYDTVNHLARGMEAAGRPIPGLEVLVPLAVKAAFPDVAEKQVKREVLQKVEKRQKMMTARPTRRRTSKITGEERAFETAERFYQEHAINNVGDVWEGDI